MQRADVVALVLVAGVAVVAAVVLKGPDPSPDLISQPMETGGVRVPLERSQQPPQSVAEEAPPERTTATPEDEEDEPAGAPADVLDTTSLGGDLPQVLAREPPDLTQIEVSLFLEKPASVAEILEQLGEDHGFEVEFEPGTRQRLEDCKTMMSLQETGLEDVLWFLGTLSRTRLVIRDGKVHAARL